MHSDLSRRPRGLLPALLLICLGSLPACEDNTGPLGGPLSFEMTGDSLGTAGDSVRVQYDAVGRSLNGVIFTWAFQPCEPSAIGKPGSTLMVPMITRSCSSGGLLRPAS